MIDIDDTTISEKQMRASLAASNEGTLYGIWNDYLEKSTSLSITKYEIITM